MEDEPTEPTEPAEAFETIDPVRVVQDAIAKIADDGDLGANFALVVEWLQEDGTSAFSVLHSPQTPWHLYGLLSYARDTHCGNLTPVSVYDADEDDDDF